MNEPKKIVFIEDDEAFYTACSIELKLKGYQVTHVSDGAEAKQVVLTVKPDLILLDIILPSKNGLEILQDLKEDVETKNYKVVMLTNFGSDDNIKKAIDMGAEDYIMKYNIVPSELTEKVAGIFGESDNSAVKLTG